MKYSIPYDKYSLSVDNVSFLICSISLASLVNPTIRLRNFCHVKKILNI